MFHPVDEEEGTPCPIRSSFPGSNYNAKPGSQQPQTSFPLVALDDDETEDLDFTRDFPDDFQLFPKRVSKRRAVLHEPPRRMTGWASQNQNRRQSDDDENARVPEKAPERVSDRIIDRVPERIIDKAPERVAERIIERAPERVPERAPQRATESNFHVDVISALQPQQQVRGQGLHQQPRRMGIGMTRKIETKNRRRISTMLAARKSQVQSTAPQDQQEVSTIAPPISTQQEQGHNKSMLGDKTHTVSNSQASLKSDEKPVERKSAFEKKPLFVPPRRMPLQAPSRGLHQPGIDVARRENSGGKENVPPGRFSVAGGDEKRMGRGVISGGDKAAYPASRKTGSGGADMAKMKPPDRPASRQAREPQRFTRESLKRPSESMILDDEDMSFISSGSTPSTAGSGNTSHIASDKLRLLKRRKIGLQLPPTPPALSKEEEAELAPFSLPMDLLPPGASFRGLGDRRSKQGLNPVLQEDLSRTEMYEDSWLLAQESSVSQLLNSILSDSFSPTTTPSEATMRKDFIRIYSSAPFPLLFKRLQASLLYGALSVPKDVLEKSSAAKLGGPGVGLNGQGWGWAEDIAVRKKFMGLFFDCYDLSALISGLEVVIGREMFPVPCRNVTERKRLAEVFLERYVIKCEDALACPPIEDATRGRGGPATNSHGDNEDWGSPPWLLRKSILRTLMLVLLMDKAKAQGTLGRLRLFRKSSPYKSSASILHALSRLLLPSVGDILRPLGHLNYLPETVQHSLEEYEYEISNLAVDMRDGVRLCRVVELLLYPRPPQSVSTEPDSAIKSIQQQSPLSSNLKLPASTRTHKLHNASLALTALESVGGNPRKVTAKDIVDGFREKTVGLLWGVVSRWGLELLVDWNEVRKEIRRLENRSHRGSPAPRTVTDDGDVDESSNHVRLLWKWASSIAKLHDLRIENLTTSFSDGRVFGKIVEEYEQFFPVNMKREKNAPLMEKLKALGCSSYFAGLFSDSQKHERVFDKDFVVAGLAYLCSRLFQWSVKERAAMTIQRAYRAYTFRHMSHRRINLLILAHECADVVNTRTKVTNAAITIQRAYREYLHLQINKLVNGMTKVQSIMRGALARREFEKSRATIVMAQRLWRKIRESRFQARIGIAREAMMGFQAVARGLLLRKGLEQQRIAVKTLEGWWRNHLLGQDARTDYLILRSATTMIQKWWRNQVVIQEPRSKYLLARRAMVDVQAFARGMIVRQRCETQLQAALVIQQQFRAYRAGLKARLEFFQLQWAALTVQKLRRSAIATRQERGQFLALRTQAVNLQRHWLETIRRRKAATMIQKSWRQFAWLVRLRKILGEVVLIQSAWRGYKVRQASNARVRIARRRVVKAMSVQAPEDERLSGRVRKGSELVKTNAGYGRGVMQLDLATRYSRECAIMVAANETVMTALLSNIDSVKQMHKAVAPATHRNLSYAVNILSNISQSPQALAILVKPNQRVAKKGVSSGQPSQAAIPKDVFSTLLDLIEVLKTAPQSEKLFFGIVEILARAVVSEGVSQRLLARKKWVEKLGGIMKGIKADGEKKALARGGKAELMKADALERLIATLQG